jgi:hypothetical protein
MLVYLVLYRDLQEIEMCLFGDIQGMEQKSVLLVWSDRGNLK